jgi:acetyl esterase/lipase
LAYGSAPRQTLDLFLPERAHPRLFVFIHGGGWRGGDKEHYRALGELLSNFGYAVALPNHRLAPQHPYPAAAEDVAQALQWVLRYAAESGIRRDGIFLAGHSSGAHLAALLALHPRFLPAAGVGRASLAGVVGISGVYSLDPYAGATPVVDYLEPVFGADPAVWSDASPARWAHGDMPPFFLAYAEHDYPGADAQAAAMAEAVEHAGGAAHVVAVPGRDHVTILTGVRSALDPLAVGLALFLRTASAR